MRLPARATPLRERFTGGRGTSDPEAAYGRAAGYGDGGGTADAEPVEGVVRNLDDYFDPQVLRVVPGTTVDFVNDGPNPHTVTLVGLYGYILPLVLYASLVAISLWDLIRREELTRGRRLGWMTVVLIVPFAGPALYLLLGGSAIERTARLFLVFGARAISLVVAAIAFLVQAI